MTMISIVPVLVIIPVTTAVLITRLMFRSRPRTEFRYDGHALGMFHVVDPYIVGLFKGHYRTGKKDVKKSLICNSDDCDGCAYAKLSALLHRGPHRECYRRFIVRHLPWNVLRRAIQRKRKVSGSTGPVPGQQRKEVAHNAYVDAPIAV